MQFNNQQFKISNEMLISVLKELYDLFFIKKTETCFCSKRMNMGHSREVLSFTFIFKESKRSKVLLYINTKMRRCGIIDYETIHESSNTEDVSKYR